MYLRVNDVDYEVEVLPGDRLLDVLRVSLDLTGTKEACGVGECGACTVLLDGLPVLSCVTLATRVKSHVTTVEGVAMQSPHLCRAFAEQGGFQCGFCTPGQLVTAQALIARGVPASEAEQRCAQSGNICRCTGYAGILRATREAAGSE